MRTPAGGREGGWEGEKETKQKEGEIEEDGDRAIERAKTPLSSPGRTETDGQRTHRQTAKADGNESLIVADRRWANKHDEVNTPRGVDRIILVTRERQS